MEPRPTLPEEELTEARKLLQEALDRLDSGNATLQGGVLWRLVDAAGLVRDACRNAWHDRAPTGKTGRYGIYDYGPFSLQ